LASIYAIHKGFDFVALVHGDGQYAPERVPELLAPLVRGEADTVFGSRMMGRDALKGGMPYYKYAGNRIIPLRVSTLFGGGPKRIPFERYTNDFHFDTEIIIQLFRAKLRMREIAIPKYYGDEICHVNGLKYAFDVIKTTLLSRAQDLSLLYQRKFDVIPPRDHANYQPKMGYDSPRTMVISRVAPGSRVLDIGCASGYMARELSEKGCTVSGIDQYAVPRDLPLKDFCQHNLDDPDFPVSAGSFDYILLLDVIGHLRSPQKFVESLRPSSRNSGITRLVVSTGIIAFGMTRMLFLLGMFNYGPRGILDLTHTRLFTFTTMRALFEQCGYVIDEVQGVPAPLPLALGDNALSRFLLGVNRLLIRLSRGFFSYQIFMVVRPLPTLEVLLQDAIECSDNKAAASRK
jgi:SAM-dependent methyltransferase